MDPQALGGSGKGRIDEEVVSARVLRNRRVETTTYLHESKGLSPGFPYDRREGFARLKPPLV